MFVLFCDVSLWNHSGRVLQCVHRVSCYARLKSRRSG